MQFLTEWPALIVNFNRMSQTFHSSMERRGWELGAEGNRYFQAAAKSKKYFWAWWLFLSNELQEQSNFNKFSLVSAAEVYLENCSRNNKWITNGLWFTWHSAGRGPGHGTMPHLSEECNLICVTCSAAASSSRSYLLLCLTSSTFPDHANVN